MTERKKASPKQMDYRNGYNRKKYDRLSVMLPKGTRDKYRSFAQSMGKSLNALIIELLEKAMKDQD